jgi:hypothetical protein
MRIIIYLVQVSILVGRLASLMLVARIAIAGTATFSLLKSKITKEGVQNSRASANAVSI